jgi:hypothetical protein
VQSEHIVHFFDDDRARVDAVAGYVADALAARCSVLVVARTSLWTAVSERLKRDGVEIDPAVRIVALDAQAVLAGLLSDGRVLREQFEATVVPLVHDLARVSAGLKVYGEMVDILAAERNFTAACELEVCWNDLAMRESFTLLCGYASAHFASRNQRESLATVCTAHTSVRTDATDALGSWLVRSVAPQAAATTFSSAARAGSSGSPSSAGPQS